MLWSLLKVLFFVVIIGALALAGSYLLQTGEGVQVVLGGTEFTLGPLTAVILALVLVCVIWLIFKAVGLIVAVLRFLNGDETAMSRYLDRSREKRGYEALADGILALTAGEGRLAINKAMRAERFLNRPELTDLVIAQAAEQVGDSKRAGEAWKRLLTDERTRFVALRGLIRQKMAAGDTETALKLAERAFAMRPRHEEIQDVLMKLQASGQDWKGARKTLAAKQKSGHLPKDVFLRRDAVMALQEAREVFREGNSVEAREAAITAARQSPDLIPAVVMAARSYIEQGDTRNAARLLRKAWEMRPHPEIAAAFAEIVPQETPVERLQRFDVLLRLHPQDEETRLLRAELNIAAEDFPAARRALGDLAESHPTARVMTIMAAIARGEGAQEAVVRGWLARALTAPRGPQWVCDNCHAVHSAWAPVCSNCGGFDTLSWTEAPETVGLSPTQSELLPLMVRSSDPPPPAPETQAPPDPSPQPEPPPAEPRVVDLDAMRRAEN